jgi:glycosyltransferase involved in cell wall biosynthesis
MKKSINASGEVLEFSVILLTYNHEAYIEQSIESVLNQKDAPSHEIIVAEDYSTDRTRDLIDNLEFLHPGRFKVLDRGRNLGLSSNLQDAWLQCQGRYISILEGDDYWNDDLKLVKTKNAMDSNPSWAGCFNAIQKINADGKKINQRPSSAPNPTWIGIDDLIKANIIGTYSAVTYRRGLVETFPNLHSKVKNGDWILNLLHSKHGGFGFLPDPMTSYRIHSKSLWSSKGDLERWLDILKVWDNLDDIIGSDYAENIRIARKTFLEECEQRLRNLNKIERRYFAFGLDRLAHFLSFFTWKNR